MKEEIKMIVDFDLTCACGARIKTNCESVYLDFLKVHDAEHIKQVIKELSPAPVVIPQPYPVYPVLPQPYFPPYGIRYPVINPWISPGITCGDPIPCGSIYTSSTISVNSANISSGTYVKITLR